MIPLFKYLVETNSRVLEFFSPLLLFSYTRILFANDGLARLVEHFLLFGRQAALNIFQGFPRDVLLMLQIFKHMLLFNGGS